MARVGVLGVLCSRIRSQCTYQNCLSTSTSSRAGSAEAGFARYLRSEGMEVGSYVLGGFCPEACIILKPRPETEIILKMCS